MPAGAKTKLRSLLLPKHAAPTMSLLQGATLSFHDDAKPVEIDP
jgi:hypothetical protein